MKDYIIKRLLWLLPIIFGVTLLSFSMMQLAAGDVVDVLYDQSGAVSEAVKAARRSALGLDKPFLEQYISWLGGVVQGDMGNSYVSGRPVWEDFSSRLPATVYLMLAAVMTTLAVSLPLGILAAVRQNSVVDYLIRSGSFLGNSLPNFFTALLLIYLFSVKLGWFTAAGGTSSATGVILPAASLAIAMAAKYTRQVRAVVLEELSKPYVLGLRSRGIPEAVILTASVLRSSLVMIITLLALSIGSLLGGAAIVETIFLWDGVGKLAVDAILMRDYPLIQAYVLWMALIYVLINLAADILYCYIDPRIRLGEERQR